MQKRILRVGVLGQGRSGYGIHVRWMREDPEHYKIVAVSDEMAQRRLDAKKEFGARGYVRYQDLLKKEKGNIDLIVNALPSFLHPKGTVEALRAGYHVVCEKPLAKTVRDMDGMIAAARKNRKHLLPFQNNRFEPFFAKIQEIIASGVLGKIVYIRANRSGFSRRWDWQTLQKYWGGNLLNTGPHPMDQAVVLFGERQPQVFARLVSENPYGDADNFALVTLYGKGAPTIEVVVNSFQAYPQGSMYNISGTCGGLEGGAGGLKWKYYDPKKTPKPKKTKWSNNRAYCREEIQWLEKTWTPEEAKAMGFAGTSKVFYDNVYDVLVRKGKPMVTTAQVRRQVAVVEEALKQNPMPRKRI